MIAETVVESLREFCNSDKRFYLSFFFYVMCARFKHVQSLRINVCAWSYELVLDDE